MGENSLAAPPKVKQLPYDPAVSLLGIYPKELKAGTQTNTCTPMFITALFTITKRQKQPKCPSTDEQINKMWYSRPSVFKAG